MSSQNKKKELDSLQAFQSSLVQMLRRSVGLLDSSRSSLKNEVIEVCDRINQPTYRVAVFGPFNYGKSTLLNALLGEKALPMDLVPTTGAAIVVKYGPDPKTCIIHTDGSITQEVGTSALQDYAILDEHRQMRTDVKAVEVYCPHPLLKLGIELIDLPGTDDQQAQDDLIQKQLLSADLVIQLLDGRKLMTLSERENLRDWLLDRGINSVLFVVNFLNLMEVGDRKQVAFRLRYLAESFRAELPDGVSNLYQVDALPALRARLKGDAAAAKQTGLPDLESALQTIGAQLASGRSPTQMLTRLTVVATSVAEALKEQIDNFSVVDTTAADSRRTEIQKKAQGLIQKGFDNSVQSLRNWLTPQNLQANYRLGLAQTLEAGKTQEWLLENLQPAWNERQKDVVSWVHQAAEMFGVDCPDDLEMGFAVEPDQADKAPTEQRAERRSTEAEMAPVAIATGLGWILGGPMGAAVLAGTSHLLNNSSRKSPTQKSEASLTDIDFSQQADIYLARFSTEALSALSAYERAGNETIQKKLSAPEAITSPHRQAQLNLLQTTLDELIEITHSLAAT